MKNAEHTEKLKQMQTRQREIFEELDGMNRELHKINAMTGNSGAALERIHTAEHALKLCEATFVAAATSIDIILWTEKD